MSKLSFLAPLLYCVACASAPKVAETWPGSHLIVLEKDAAQAVVIEPNGGFVKHVFATETGPHEVCVSRNGQYAVVANYGDGKVKGHTLPVFDLVEERRERLIDLKERRVRATIAAPGGSDGLAWAFRRALPNRN